MNAASYTSHISNSYNLCNEIAAKASKLPRAFIPVKSDEVMSRVSKTIGCIWRAYIDHAGFSFQPVACQLAFIRTILPMRV